MLQKPQLFKRERINNLIDTAWDKQIIFITAPMGYGKTTIISEYLKERVYNEVPVEEKCKHLKIYLQFLIRYLPMMSYSNGIRLYQEIREYCLGLTGDQCEDTVLCQIAMMEMLCEFNHADRMRQVISVQVGKMKQKTTLLLQQEMGILYAVPGVLRLIHYERGNIEKSIEDYKKFMTASGWEVNDTYQNILQTLELELLYEKGSLDEAIEKAEGLSRKYKAVNDPILLICTCRVLFSSYIALGRVKEVESELEWMEAYIRKFHLSWLNEDFILLQRDILCALNAVQKKNTGEDILSKIKYNRVIRYAGLIPELYGKQLINQKKYDELELLAYEMLADIESESFVFKEIFGRIYLAIALFHQHKLEDTYGVMEEVLSLCSRDGLMMVFVENSLEIIPILEHMPETEFSKKVLEKCIDCIGSIPDGKAGKKSLLTPREIEVMDLVIIGSKNAEIASALHIAQITVEKTLSNIYRKLNVKNRASASRKYQEMDVI